MRQSGAVRLASAHTCRGSCSEQSLDQTSSPGRQGMLPLPGCRHSCCPAEAEPRTPHYYCRDGLVLVCSNCCCRWALGLAPESRRVCRYVWVLDEHQHRLFPQVAHSFLLAAQLQPCLENVLCTNMPHLERPGEHGLLYGRKVSQGSAISTSPNRFRRAPIANTE